eukprot:gene17925-21382_t
MAQSLCGIFQQLVNLEKQNNNYSKRRQQSDIVECIFSFDSVILNQWKNAITDIFRLELRKPQAVNTTAITTTAMTSITSSSSTTIPFAMSSVADVIGHNGLLHLCRLDRFDTHTNTTTRIFNPQYSVVSPTTLLYKDDLFIVGGQDKGAKIVTLNIRTHMINEWMDKFITRNSCYEAGQ